MRYKPFYGGSTDQPEFPENVRYMAFAEAIQFLKEYGRFPCGYIREDDGWLLFQDRNALIEAGSSEDSIQDRLENSQMWKCSLFPGPFATCDIDRNLAEIPKGLFKVILLAKGTLHIDGRLRIDAWISTTSLGVHSNECHLLSYIQRFCHAMTLHCDRDGAANLDLWVRSCTGTLMYGCMEGRVVERRQEVIGNTT